ncbi:MAG: M48 family metalloprotease [Nitrospinaceae bacterium]|nr:M48 family metalloprotease [Nitrospinaceae bacterium]MBT3435325.1 M48 family metalloprotease [Nitrospinaceae bacterium]MBT3820612.1 M48 family metalloprotease [Nitrospinaceae bacterium]MBT5366514.1 M48 family metalloprotease [Nitrospinaceae bacterium]MBT5948844.1 M48 family metalloprotease [Nitrospinaceae bacterium]
MRIEILTPQEAGTARKYQMCRLWLGLSASSIEFIITLIFWLHAPTDWFRQHGDAIVISGALYGIALVLFRHIAVFPVGYLSGFSLPHQVGLSNETLGGWFRDWSIGLLIATLLGGMASGAIVYFFTVWPRAWWWILSISGIFFSLFMGLVAPLILMPIFFKFKRLEDAELNGRLDALLNRAGVRVRDGIWEIDMSRRTMASNAALIGWGPSRSIVLSDTLSDNEPEEIEAIVAHEIAHHVGRHVGLQFAGMGVMLIAALYLADLIFSVPEMFIFIGVPVPKQGDPSVVGALWFFITLGNFFTSPFLLWVSRQLEYWCDRYAARITGGGGALAGALEKLCRKNMADPEPPGWVVVLFHSHPPLGERIRRVREIH